MKRLIFLLGFLFIALGVSFSQQLEKMTAYNGVYEYSNGSDTKKFFAFEADAGTIITKISVKHNGSYVSNARSQFIGSSDTLKVGGIYYLPVGAIGDTLTVVGSVKKLIY